MKLGVIVGGDSKPSCLIESLSTYISRFWVRLESVQEMADDVEPLHN